jgi:hypothetical protein
MVPAHCQGPSSRAFPLLAIQPKKKRQPSRSAVFEA